MIELFGDISVRIKGTNEDPEFCVKDVFEKLMRDKCQV